MRYLVRLKPVNQFFFGGENTFGEGAKVNYLVKSNPFPQQTTLLGTIRKEILIQGGLLKVTDCGEVMAKNGGAEVADLIGPESFNLEKDNQQFGVIKRLSPVFLYNADDSESGAFFIQAPKDHKLTFERHKGKTNLNLKRPKLNIPHLKGYKAKNGIKTLFKNSVTREIIGFDEIFEPMEKIGITKGIGGKADEKAFYKQTSYRFLKGFEFAFIIDLDFDLNDGLVFMGADRTAFLMRAINFDKSFEAIFPRDHGKERIVLLSDACVSEDIFDDCHFAITDVIDFRNITTSSTKYSPKKVAEKYTFLQRGSVLYPGDAEKVKKKFDNGNLKQIGYNIIT